MVGSKCREICFVAVWPFSQEVSSCYEGEGSYRRSTMETHGNSKYKHLDVSELSNQFMKWRSLDRLCECKTSWCLTRNAFLLAVFCLFLSWLCYLFNCNNWFVSNTNLYLNLTDFLKHDLIGENAKLLEIWRQFYFILWWYQ